jgi:anti-anti-sigma factor
VVVRSEAESGGVGLRLIGELDLNTVDLFEAELARTRAGSPPSVIDLSELCFLDLVGLRALLRGAGSDAAGTTRLVGATGIVRRLIDLAHTLDDEAGEPTRAPFPAEPRTRVRAQHQDEHAPASGASGRGAATSNSSNGKPR